MTFLVLVFATLAVMIDSQCLKSEVLQKKTEEARTWGGHNMTLLSSIEERFAFRDFLGKVAEIQETLGNLKNKEQGAVPSRWSDKRSVSEYFAFVSMANMEGEERKDMKFSDRISKVRCWAKELAGSNSRGDSEHSRFVPPDEKTHSDTHTFGWGRAEWQELFRSSAELKFDLEEHLKWSFFWTCA